MQLSLPGIEISFDDGISTDDLRRLFDSILRAKEILAEEIKPAVRAATSQHARDLGLPVGPSRALVKWLGSRGFTQQKLAELIGSSPAEVSKFSTGATYPYDRRKLRQNPPRTKSELVRCLRGPAARISLLCGMDPEELWPVQSRGVVEEYIG